MTTQIALTKRPLNGYEKYLWISGQSGSYSTATVLKLKFKVDMVRLRRGLDDLQKQHFLLRAHILKDQENFFLSDQKTKKIPIKIQVCQNSSSWQERMEEEFKSPFKLEEPLLRVICLHHPSTSDLIILAHHLVNDGISAIELSKNILTNLSQDNSTLFNWSFPERSLNFDPLAKLINSKRHVSNETFHLEKRNEKIIPTSECGYIHKRLSKKDTSRIIKSAKENLSSVQSLLLASLYCSMSNHCKTDKGNFKIESPVNLRPYLSSLGVELNDLGCYFGQLDWIKPIRVTTNLWSLSKSFRKDIKARVNDCLARKSFLQAERISSGACNDTHVKAKKFRTGPYLGISNLGIIKLEEFKDSIDDLFILANFADVFYGQDSLYVVASTLFDQLKISLIYPKLFMKKSVANSVLVDAIESVLAEKPLI